MILFSFVNESVTLHHPISQPVWTGSSFGFVLFFDGWYWRRCCGSGRRTTLPAPGTDNSHIGIMTILYNNIGKDLSRVSMPVALNEPVSLLQRLSEELEYSDLLDIANHIDDPYERMVCLAHCQ